MKKLSTFDIVMIVLFVVIGLLGGGAWYYFSSQLAATQQAVASASSDFAQYSSHEVFLPTASNVKTVQANIDLIHQQLDPIIKDQLQNPGDKLPDTAKEDTDTVKWKQHLDQEVGRLNDAAKTHGVLVPANFYYGFSRYLSTNPANDQIVVLSKQLLGVVEMANIFINAPVRSIATFRRTYEEDPNAGTGPGAAAPRADSDILPGHSSSAAGDVYTTYPFEIEFESDTASFRKVIDALLKSPYVFVVRSVIVQNDKNVSPQVTDLDKMMGNNEPGVTDSSPGSVGTDKSNLPPQWLFGKELLHIKIRVDMIEWNHISEGNAAPNAARGGRGGRAGRAGGGFGGGGGGGNE